MTNKPVLRLRAQLVDVDDPEVVRLLDVPAGLRLSQLHAVLQLAFGWNDSHLHCFTTADPYEPGPAGHSLRWLDLADLADLGLDVSPGDRDEDQASIGELIGPGPVFYDYDFGSWVHRLDLVPGEAGPLAQGEWARLIDGTGRCPPENVGGLVGWQLLKEAWRDQDPAWRAQQRQLLETVPIAERDLDPDRIDIGLIQRQLRLLPQPNLWEFGADTLVWELIDRVPHLGQVIVLSRGCLETPPDVTPADREAFLHPVQWLLERIGDGLNLTQAGWLPPKVVREAVAEFGWDESLYGKANRETHVWWLANLRKQLTRFGLLRKSRGIVTVTAAARAAINSDDALWKLLVGRMATRWPDDASRIAGGYFLLSLTSERPSSFDEDRAFALLGLLIHGFASSEGPPTKDGAWWLIRDLWALFAALGAITESGRWPDEARTPTSALRRFATDVLLWRE